MFENGRPRYWIDWYDPWYLLLPLLLVGVLAAIRWMPVSTPVRMVPTLPVVRTLSNQARLVVPLP